MLWFVVWTVLVLGAAVLLALLGLRLWRRVRALLEELGQAGELLERLDDHSETLKRSAVQAPGVHRDPATLAAAEQLREDVRERRRRRSEARLSTAVARWRDLGMLE